MTWFKVDDKAHSNSKFRKVLAEDPAALALWVVAGSWSSDNLTDGFVPDHQLPWLIPAGSAELALTLVTARLWRRVKGGYQFHQWMTDGDGTKRNPSRVEVEAERRKKAEAGRKGGLASGKTRSKREAPASAFASAPASGVLEPPTRPDPPPSKEGGEGVARHASRGAARSPQRPALTVVANPENPDWRTLPAYGQAEPRPKSPAAAEARAAIRAPKRAPEHRGAFDRLVELTDPEEQRHA